MRILVVSDIHGNADAFKAVLENAKNWDYLWVLGDLVDYGPEPHVVVDMVKELKPDVIVMGNHDYAVVYGVDCRCGPELHELSVYTRMNISMKLLSKEQIEWLKSLPLKIEKRVSGKKVYVVHGSPRNPLYGYLKPDLTYNEFRSELSTSSFRLTQSSTRLIDVDTVLVGHTHIPMVVKVDNVTVANPGSCGQPRDGDARASYAIFDPENSVLTIHRVEYDIEKVVKKLEDLKLDRKYFTWIAEILRRGEALSK